MGLPVTMCFFRNEKPRESITLLLKTVRQSQGFTGIVTIYSKKAARAKKHFQFFYAFRVNTLLLRSNNCLIVIRKYIR
ncbi:hypothetical protein CTT35_11365 [Photobacterium damselae]|nr:hypothetical protein CTT35_11365 [Photobacterium damselae]